MCGIAGFATAPTSSPAGQGDLQAMCDAIMHRGPDDDGMYCAAGIGIGMRRLSIIDVAGGRQPIANEDGTVRVVFNGEIYNHRALRASLIRSGHHFATTSDTEAIVHQYEQSGPKVVDSLRGMFALAIWDERCGQLLLARDRLGIKPLYYWERDGSIYFCSELRSLLALTRFSPSIDRDAVAWYLALGYVPEPMSIFVGVRKLPPGHILVWKPDGTREVSRYWSANRAEVRGLDDVTAVAEARRLIEDSVSHHLESEVPLGAFLSGGIDSSTVVAAMSRELSRPVRTFSIGFEDPDYNEAPHAAAVARALRTRHTALIVRPTVDALVDEVVGAYDEPFADSSAIPTYVVSHLARQQVTVALSGDGGDEIFGGYTRFTELLRRRVLPSVVRHGIDLFARHLPLGSPGRNRMLDLGRTRNGRYAATIALPLSPAEGGLARADLVDRVGGFDSLLEPWFAEADGRDFATQMMLVDLNSYLPGDILTKLDRASMSASLEARVPLLDHFLVEFAVSLPSNLKMRDGTGKWILRRAVEDLVPTSVLQKPKQGFGVPLARWFRRELRHRVEAILSPASPVHEFLEPNMLRCIAQEHLSGRRDHSAALWRVFVLHRWLEQLATGALARPLSSAPPLEIVRQARTA